MRGVQVKLRDPLRTHAIPEHFRGVFTRRCCTNQCLPLPLPYIHVLCKSFS